MPRVVPEYKEDAKRRIIEAAIDVIAEQGSDKMRIDDVAKRLGVTKGAVYWYFKTKEDLLSAVLNKVQTDMQKIEFETYYNRSLEETLAQMFDRFDLDDDRQRAIYFEMFALATRNPEVRQATLDYYEGLVSTFEAVIKKKKRQYFLQTLSDDRTLALLMVALYTGLKNYKLVHLYEDQARDLWLEGIRILLNPSYFGSYGEKVE